MILKSALVKAYLIALVLMLSAGAASFCLGCWRAIQAPYELDTGEGAVLWQVQRVTHLTEAYHRMENLPYMVFHYPPLYHLVTRGFAVLTQDILAGGRLASFVSALLVALVLAVFTGFALPRRFPRFLRLGASATCGLLCLNLSTMAWAELMRVDLLALFFTFAGLLLFLLAPRVRHLDYAAFLFFTLAFFTKQTEVAAPAACLMIAFTIDRGRAVRLGAFMAIAIGAGLAGLSWATNGDVLRNLVLYNVNPFSVMNMLGIVQLNLSSTAPLAAVALTIPLLSFARIRRLAPAARVRTVRWWLATQPSRRALALASVHMLLALLVSFTCGKRGSNYNYFIEWNLAGCMLFSAALAFFLNHKKALTGEVAVLLVALLLGTDGVASLAERLRPRGVPEKARISSAVSEFLRQVDGPVYSEDITLLIKSGKEAFAEPAIITNLAESGGWDQNPFIERIKAGFFRAIIVTTSLDNRNRYTPEVQAAIEGAYRVDRNYGNYQIYFAKARSANGSATGLP